MITITICRMTHQTIGHARFWLLKHECPIQLLAGMSHATVNTLHVRVERALVQLPSPCTTIRFCLWSPRVGITEFECTQTYMSHLSKLAEKLPPYENGPVVRYPVWDLQEMHELIILKYWGINEIVNELFIWSPNSLWVFIIAGTIDVLIKVIPIFDHVHLCEYW